MADLEFVCGEVGVDGLKNFRQILSENEDVVIIINDFRVRP